MSCLADYPDVLTVEEAAKVLRIGRSAAYSAAKRGDLPTIPVGRTLRVPKHRLQALLDGDDSQEE
jgi:excisionase family DNA binding protein